MRVYGWTGYPPPRCGFKERQVRAIVVAKSLAAASRASEAAGLGKVRRAYCSPTANAQELEIAQAQPGVVFARGLNDHKGKYVPLSGGKR